MRPPALKAGIRTFTALLVLTGAACESTPPTEQRTQRPIEYEMAVQRATEAAIWAMPAVSVWDIAFSTQRDLGGDIGDIVYFTHPMDSKHGFLTANDVTPYAVASLSTRDGPIVVEVPPAGEKASFFGTFVDAWQTPIADVGPPGQDEGRGGKYLFLPPAYEGPVPGGYFVHQPQTYSVNFAFRPVARNGGTHADQAAYVQRLATYSLAEAQDPPPTRFIDAAEQRWNTLPVYDMTFFQDLATVIQNEPVLERDKAMMALLATIGIEKGKPFEPDAELTRALEEGLQRAYDWMQNYFTTPGKAMVPFWDNRQWQVWQFAEGQPEAGFPYVTDDRVLIDERAGGSYFWITYLPKQLGGGTFYLTGLRDSDGKLMDGTSTYQLRIPSDTPANDFWSVIVYSMATKGFVEGVDRVGLSTPNVEGMQVNDDGSVDVYFAPMPPSGMESNWIPTGEDFFLLFRLYGPGDALFDRSWVLPDVEKVN